jgi:branched-chain amino acid transport system ATP-binding protein
MGPICLEIRKVTKDFKGLRAVNEVSFSLRNGEIVSIIGPNGAGKTSLFNLITGVYSYTGKILFQEIEIMRKEPYEIASLGIARTFQHGGLFKEMTVLENVMLGLHGTLNSGFFSSILRLPSVKQSEEEITKKSLEALRNINLETKSDTLSGNLSYGEQKLVELARAIVGKPRLLLLDEPGAGLNETEKEKLIELVQALKKDEGMTILLVEHHMDMVMRISDKIIALNFGQKIAEGSPEEITKNPEVITAYLGVEEPYAGDS